ncbi:hypothetical protein PoB_005950500 [Plakobranchus ocellatus]|uniref:Uncharacterized protein n=1 Tax=Plakobranchus ocellatus TaxID=259542 RepID=A0AAV4CMC4_9GAST|nr:hypothetical protein PoB_005950500 [Plakobranchus ocellatus]
MLQLDSESAELVVTNCVTLRDPEGYSCIEMRVWRLAERRMSRYCDALTDYMANASGYAEQFLQRKIDAQMVVKRLYYVDSGCDDCGHEVLSDLAWAHSGGDATCDG